MKLQNKPGEPIVTREKGTKFYCLACHKEYRKCKCKVYQSADTLTKVAKIGVFGAGTGILGAVIKPSWITNDPQAAWQGVMYGFLSFLIIIAIYLILKNLCKKQP